MANNEDSLKLIMKEKLFHLKRALVLETDAAQKFKLTHEIKEIQEQFNIIDRQNFQQKTANIMNNKKSNLENKQINIFVSYSSRDRDLREILVEGIEKHLKQRSGYQYNVWTDREIDCGENWKQEIDDALSRSNVALLLVDSNFVSSKFIQEEELTAFFAKKKEDFLIIPVLLRQYNFEHFEKLAQLQFFKTYHSEYGFSKPTERNKLLPFDKLGDNESTTDEQLNLYYKNLAEKIHDAVSNKFPK